MYLCSMDKGKTWTKLSECKTVGEADLAAREIAKRRRAWVYFVGCVDPRGVASIERLELDLKLFTFISAGPTIYVWADSYGEALAKTPFRDGGIPFEVRC